MSDKPIKHDPQRFQPLCDEAVADLARDPVTEESKPHSPKQHTVDALLQELQVHQLELEAQNEALRLAQTALEASRDRYIDLYEFAPDGYFSITIEGLITAANLKAATMLGVNRSKLIQRRFAEFVAHDDQERWYHLLQYMNEANVEQKDYSLDVLVTRHDQSTFYAHLNCLHITELDAQPVLRVSLTNISQLKALSSKLEARIEARSVALMDANLRLKQEVEEHKRIGAELKKSQGEFHLLVETMSEGLVVCNKKGRITYINDRFCEMLQRSREDILGHPATKYIEESSRAEWRQQVAKVKAGIATSCELKLKGLEKFEIWAKVSPSPQFDQHGKVVGSFAVVTDISDRIRAEHILRESKNHLHLLSEQVMAAQEKERQRVSAELHDGIGQTLSAVKFSVETGIKRLYEQPSEESFRQLESVIPRIQDAIEEVRRISMALRPSMLDDIGILATLTWFCRESGLVYKNLSIQLQLDIKEEYIPVQIKVVIFRIVQEAFNNTVKHSGAELVRISLKHTGQTIALNIADNGIGFDMDRIGQNGNRRAGLGLTSMRERAEFSGGLYSVSSAKGNGTRIQVTWTFQVPQ